jgi:RimJ/RimL family protein N-acetyltransferase
MTTLFETDRLIVRPWSVEDAEAAFAMFGDPEVMRYVGDTGEPHPDVAFTRERLRARNERWGASSGLGNWAAVEKQAGAVIGGGGLALLEDLDEVEVFYHFRKDCWGKGYATELTLGLLEYGFAHLDRPRLIGLAYPANVASHRVMTKAGMTHLGLRQAYGTDLEYFEIVRPLAIQDP